jgi:colanic acid/amylovoran biosynthesis glycosyltransferase
MINSVHPQPLPWVLHSAPELGNVTERWIELQSMTHERFETMLLGMSIASGVNRQPHWLVVSDGVRPSLSTRLMARVRGPRRDMLANGPRSDQPAVIHAHYGFHATQMLPLARSLGRPLVASFYGFDATETRFVSGRKWRRRYSELFRRVDAIFAEGPAMASRIERLGCPPAKIQIVPLPADADGLARVTTDKPDYFLVSLAGRFIEKKGFDVGIKVFARALRGRSDARLLIIGGGELDEKLRRLVVEEGIESQVTWAGRLPFEEFMTQLARAHIGLYPSRTAENGDSEGGAPVTLIEAQWLGVPALVSDHDDLPFVAAPEGAVVLRPRDIEGWSEALLELYRAPERVQTMSAAARTFVRDRHSPRANARARESIYERVS